MITAITTITRQGGRRYPQSGLGSGLSDFLPQGKSAPAPPPTGQSPAASLYRYGYTIMDVISVLLVMVGL